MTAEQLDADMADYFVGKEGATNEAGSTGVNGQTMDSVASTKMQEPAQAVVAPTTTDMDIDMID